jgi:hypothetical protein
MGLPYDFTARARIRLSRAEVAAINTDTALAARRFIYSTPSSFVHIDADDSVVDGPTEFLRKPNNPPGATGFFSASTHLRQ